jgi:hypothetical protein
LQLQVSKVSSPHEDPGSSPEQDLRIFGRSPASGGNELAVLIEGSTDQLESDVHRAGHSEAGDFARWGRLGDLETLHRYGRPWLSLLARRRWKKIGADALDRYRAEQLAAKAGVA